MILRRLSTALRKQDWFTVAVETLIVMFGVFLGLQVNNWNEARAEEESYHLARVRLVAEIDANLNKISLTKAELADVIPRVSNGIDALRTCASNPEATALVAGAIREAQLTRGHQFTQSTLTELTENAGLLGRQSESDRLAFQNLRNTVDQLQFEANFLEAKPLDEPIWRHPMLTMSAASTVDATYRGVVWRLLERDLSLSEPMDVACKDDSLLASLYEYERMQSGLDAVLTIATVEMNAVKTLILGDDQREQNL
jgi:hypothetical protein